MRNKEERRKRKLHIHRQLKKHVMEIRRDLNFFMIQQKIINIIWL